MGAVVLALIAVVLLGMAWGGTWFEWSSDESDIEYSESLDGWEQEGAVEGSDDWEDTDDSDVGDFYGSFSNAVFWTMFLTGIGFAVFLVTPFLGGRFGFLNTAGAVCMTIAFILMIVGAIWFAFGHTAAAQSDHDKIPDAYRPDHDGPWTTLYGSESDNDSEWHPGMAFYYFIAGGVFAIISLSVFRGAVLIDRTTAGRPIRPAYRDERYRPRDHYRGPPPLERRYRDGYDDRGPRRDRYDDRRDRYNERRDRPDDRYDRYDDRRDRPDDGRNRYDDRRERDHDGRDRYYDRRNGDYDRRDSAHDTRVGRPPDRNYDGRDDRRGGV